MQSSIGSERSSQLISSLHAILKPFLLRRLKCDVEQNLPPKKEYVLYAPLSVQQREAYDRVLEGSLRSYLIGKGKEAGHVIVTEEEENGERKLRKKGRKSYAVDGDDDEYFDMLEKGEVNERGVMMKEEHRAVDQLGREHQLKSTRTFCLVLFVRLGDKAEQGCVFPCSQTSEQHEAPEYRHAAPKSLLPPIPV